MKLYGDLLVNTVRNLFRCEKQVNSSPIPNCNKSVVVDVPLVTASTTTTLLLVTS